MPAPYRDAPLRPTCTLCGGEDARRQCARCRAPVCDRELLGPNDFCEPCEDAFAAALHAAGADRDATKTVFAVVCAAAHGPYLAAWLAAPWLIPAWALGCAGAGGVVAWRRRRRLARVRARAARL